MNIFLKSMKLDPHNGEIQLTDALQKLDSIYGVTFRQRPVTRKQLEWLKTSIEFALDNAEFRDDLVDYMKSYI